MLHFLSPPDFVHESELESPNLFEDEMEESDGEADLVGEFAEDISTHAFYAAKTSPYGHMKKSKIIFSSMPKLNVHYMRTGLILYGYYY